MACHLSLSAVHVAGLAVTKGTARLAFAMTSTGARPFKVIVYLIFILLAAVNEVLAHLGFLDSPSNIDQSRSQTKLFVGTSSSSSAVRSQILVTRGLLLTVFLKYSLEHCISIPSAEPLQIFLSNSFTKSVV